MRKWKKRGCGWREWESKNWTGIWREGVAAWKQAGLPVATVAQITPQDLEQQLSAASAGAGRAPRAGVGRGHIEGAAWWPLDNFRVSPPEIDHEMPLAVHCKGGYRSMIAASLLQRAGFRHVFNVAGGFDAWQQAKLPSCDGDHKLELRKLAFSPSKSVPSGTFPCTDVYVRSAFWEALSETGLSPASLNCSLREIVG